MSGVRVRERRASDTRAMRAVARAAWRDTYEGRVPAELIRAVLRRGYDRRRLVTGLVEARRDSFVAERDGSVVGYADVLEDPPGHVELTRIYVHPAEQGRGAGSALLGAAVRAARRRRAVVLEIGLDPTNERAAAWYARRGFRAAGESTLRAGPVTRPILRMTLAL